MPMHMSTFHHDFPQLIFHQGGPCPLKIAYATDSAEGHDVT